jgi:superfamily II DNA or RNA helicase
MSEVQSVVDEITAVLVKPKVEIVGEIAKLDTHAEAGSLAYLLSRLASEPVHRGRQFEKVCQWFLRNAPVYAGTVRRVWLWDEWPGRWGPDAGIDLVAEDHAGRLWAIQAKAFARHRQITKSDLNTFLAESARAEFGFRLVIGTTDRISPLAARTMAAQEKPVGQLLLSDLEAAAIRWPDSPEALSQTPPPRRSAMMLRPHQEDAIDDVLTGFRNQDRGQLIMACGTGKTLTALAIHERLDADRTLVLLPSLALLDQTVRDWLTNSGTPFERLVVCSDATADDSSEDCLSRTAELGFPVTTEPDAIANFLRANHDGRPAVVFATYQSSPRIAEAMQSSQVPPFNLAVCDEAHRCTGRADSAFTTVLDAAAIRVHRRLFMTATPRFFTTRVKNASTARCIDVASMDDAALFGGEFHRLSFAGAISRGLLTDYRVVVVCIDDTEYQRWVHDGRLVARSGAPITDAATLASQIGLAKTLQRYDLRRVITFHSRVKRAHQFATEFADVVAWLPESDRPTGAIAADYISGRMPAGQRRTKLRSLRTLNPGQRGILCNARCLTEGVDLPALDAVAFVDPRSAEVDVIQAVGRAIRLAPGKALGTIVIPVFIDSAESPYEALENGTAFRPVWEIIKALRAHDEDLGIWIDRMQLHSGGSATDSGALPDKLDLQLPEWVDHHFAHALGVKLVKETSDPWEVGFGHLKQFASTHGSARVPFSYRVDDFWLGLWVATQRRSHRVGTLPASQAKRLSALPGWVWATRTRPASWEDNFTRLSAYVDHHGTARVPARYTDSDGFYLGRWIERQCVAYATGRLDPNRAERLAALPGWIWNGGGTRTGWAQAWENGYEHLTAFSAEFTTARVPQAHVCEDGFRLGQWVSSQRRAYACGALPPERARRLTELPRWTWSTKAAIKDWEQGFTRACDFVAQHGHARIPRGHLAEDGFALGGWVISQRLAHASGSLKADRAGRLSALPGWFWSRDLSGRWDHAYGRLCRYATMNGTAQVPASYKDDDGFNLGTWVVTQRKSYRRAGSRTSRQLTADRIALLAALPGWTWHIPMPTFEDGFGRMCDYVARTGSARVLGRHVEDDGFKLGRWVANQRRAFKLRELAPDRVARLEALPGWIWSNISGTTSTRVISEKRLRP